MDENIKVTIRRGYIKIIIDTYEEDKVVEDLKEIFKGIKYNVCYEDERKIVDRYER